MHQVRPHPRPGDGQLAHLDKSSRKDPEHGRSWSSYWCFIFLCIKGLIAKSKFDILVRHPKNLGKLKPQTKGGTHVL